MASLDADASKLQLYVDTWRDVLVPRLQAAAAVFRAQSHLCNPSSALGEAPLMKMLVKKGEYEVSMVHYTVHIIVTSGPLIATPDSRVLCRNVLGWQHSSPLLWNGGIRRRLGAADCTMEYIQLRDSGDSRRIMLCITLCVRDCVYADTLS